MRMSDTSSRPTTVFISYSHRDKNWLERLQVHLKPLERMGVFERWDDTRIQPGAKWLEAINQALTEAKVAVLLVSADFLASDFIVNDELPPLLAAAERNGTVILPVIVSPSQFEQTPNLSCFQAVNPPSQPLISLSEAEQEEVFVRIADAVRAVLQGSVMPKPQSKTPGAPTPAVGADHSHSRDNTFLSRIVAWPHQKKVMADEPKSSWRKLGFMTVFLTALGTFIFLLQECNGIDDHQLVSHCCDAFGNRRCVLVSPVVIGSSCFCIGQGSGISCP